MNGLTLIVIIIAFYVGRGYQRTLTKIEEQN
jgi:hypothetical protein